MYIYTHNSMCVYMHACAYEYVYIYIYIYLSQIICFVISLGQATTLL